MIYNIPPKPTTYHNRLYRSRLEARWAAYFELTKIIYEYEPFDLSHWSPDFILTMKTQNLIFMVEVKPIERLDQLDGPYLKRILASFGEYVILNPGQNTNILIAGLSPEYSWILKPGEYDLDIDNPDFVPSNLNNIYLKSLWAKAANEVMFYKPKL